MFSAAPTPTTELRPAGREAETDQAAVLAGPGPGPAADGGGEGGTTKGLMDGRTGWRGCRCYILSPYRCHSTVYCIIIDTMIIDIITLLRQGLMESKMKEDEDGKSVLEAKLEDMTDLITK